MTTIGAIFTAYAPQYLARFPHLPTAHRKTVSAVLPCQRGPDGHRLSQCQDCGGQHRVNHACGNRHCPQCQHHPTQQWLHRHLEKHLPGPHVLITCTVPETLRPLMRSHQPLAYAALLNASSHALKRLATDERCIGTHLPGCTGVLPPWGRQLQSHPHIHSLVPGGGLSNDRTAWLPSRDTFFVPVKALSPIYRAVFTQEMANAGLLGRIDPKVWNTAWHVHSQAHPNGATSFKYLAPSVFKVAISNSRLISLTERTVTFTYRTPGSARPRTTQLDAIACIRRVLQHVLPEGFMQVRHFGCMHANCAIPTDTLRRIILRQHPVALKAPEVEAPAPRVAACPPCGTPMQLVLRRWTSNPAFLDTG